VIPGAVVFDCDGVLVDSEPHSVAAWMAVLGAIGHPASETDVAACTGLGFEATYAAIAAIAPLPRADDLWTRLLAALGRSFERGLTVFSDAVAVVGGAVEAGIPVAVASASPRSRLDLTLDAAGLRAAFPVSVAGDEVAHGKPAPDVYLAAARLLGVDPGRCVAVEDSPAGVRAAVDAGMRTIAVVRTGADPAALAAAGAEVVPVLGAEAVGLPPRPS
jgi:beta-phosphoglucomutase-like phosphatase (HAD superfamily)